MMDIHQQMLCEQQGELFELSVDRFECASSMFAYVFMYSDIAKQLDKHDDPYYAISNTAILEDLENKYSRLKTKGAKYPKQVIYWIGYIYRAFSIIKRKSSSYIYYHFPATKMLSLYETFHTYSIEYAVDKLEELLNEQKPHVDYYDIYKMVRSTPKFCAPRRRKK